MQEIAPTAPGAAIKHRRTEMGWTQQVLATKAGVAIGTLIRLERGEDVRLATLDQVAAALDTTSAALLSPPEPEGAA